MEQRAPAGPISRLLVLVGYGIGTVLMIVGAISWGFQLVVMPVGGAVVFGLLLRKEPRLALGFAGGSLGVSAAAVLSYAWGLAPTIFIPHLGVLAVAMGGLAALGYLSARLLERRSSARRA